MNIYCVIFMCTFGANSTDTEMPKNNSLIEGPDSGSNISGKVATPPVDVASLILPEKGEPVPQIGDIVMELPKMHHNDTPAQAVASSSDSSDSASETTIPSDSSKPTLTLSDILLPPSTQSRFQPYSN